MKSGRVGGAFGHSWHFQQLRWDVDANMVKRRGDGLKKLNLTQHDLVLGLNILYAMDSEECGRPLIPLLAPLYCTRSCRRIMHQWVTQEVFELTCVVMQDVSGNLHPWMALAVSSGAASLACGWMRSSKQGLAKSAGRFRLAPCYGAGTNAFLVAWKIIRRHHTIPLPSLYSSIFCHTHIEIWNGHL